MKLECFRIIYHKFISHAGKILQPLQRIQLLRVQTPRVLLQLLEAQTQSRKAQKNDAAAALRAALQLRCGWPQQVEKVHAIGAEEYRNRKGQPHPLWETAEDRAAGHADRPAQTHSHAPTPPGTSVEAGVTFRPVWGKQQLQSVSAEGKQGLALAGDQQNKPPKNASHLPRLQTNRRKAAAFDHLFGQQQLPDSVSTRQPPA